MQPATDRHAKRGARVPLDVLVELSHDDHAEPFEADGVTLSRGGLTLRAAYLPEVGSRLACRFECPPDGAPIEADCEVVWVEGSGEHAGEFGVRFLAASEGADDRIRTFVRAMTGTSDSEQAQTDVARLYIDGIETPVVARVSHRADDLVTVEQELSFLSLGKGLALRDGDRARRGQIASIDLQLTGDVPRLVLQVLYDDEVEEVAAPSLPVVANGERTDPDLLAPSHAREADVETMPDERAPASEALDTPVPAAPRRKERETAQVVRMQGEPSQSRPRPLVDEEGLVEKGDRGRLPAGAGLLAVWAAIAIARVMPLLAKARAAAWPLLLRAWESTVAATRVVMREAGPRLRTSVAAVRRTTVPLLASAKTMILKRTSRAATPVRRTTAPPPATLDVRGVRPTTGRVPLMREDVAPVAPPRRKLGRPIVIGVAALALAGLFVWVVTAGDDDDGVPLPHAAVTAPPPASAIAPALPAQETGLTGASAPAAVTPATVQSPTELPPAAELVAPTAPAMEPPPVIDPPMPTALGAPSYVAGHLPPPTYPTLDGAPRPASAPATVPAGSPYAVDAHDRGRVAHAGVAVAPQLAAHPSTPANARSIGAPSVRNARSFTLHLTREAQGLEGGPTADGFAIRVRGALSLDRAGPLAAAHPAVARAVVMNRGDHADLQIVFKDGMHPAFRVAARGATIEILIAPR